MNLPRKKAGVSSKDFRKREFLALRSLRKIVMRFKIFKSLGGIFISSFIFGVDVVIFKQHIAELEYCKIGEGI